MKFKIKYITLYLIITMVFIFVCFFLLNKIVVSYSSDQVIKQENNTNIKSFYKALKEVAYAYYMRGINIQYNSNKRAIYSPEEATSQNMNYIVCSGFTENVYNELLDIQIPPYTENLLKYGRSYIGNREVIAYASKNSSNDLLLKLYNSSSKNNYITITNPTLQDIIPYLQIGDIMTYTGHSVLVYDLIYDDFGNVKDAYILESSHGAGKNYIKTKIASSITIGNNISFGSANHFLYYNNKTNTNYNEGLNEGSIHLTKLTDLTYWSNLNTDKKRDEYSILRFIDADNNGNIILNYQGSNYGDRNHSDETINLSQTNQDRLKFSKLYIEKTVDVHADSVVDIGDKLTYTILIKNNSNKNYTDNITVTENISDYVEIVNNGNGVINGNKITWQIGKLAAGASKKISYTVITKKNTYGKIIESTGTVEHIPSTVIKNLIGYNLKKEQMSNIEIIYNNLKNKYTGKVLVNEIYKEALGIDLQFDKFDITNLINDTKKTSTVSTTISLNKSNNFYEMVLNNYWSTMHEKSYTYNGANIVSYDLKLWKSYDSSLRRADTIYSETFRTGDILIYKNTNDVLYSYKNNTLSQSTVTYENGEYAYIFIEGKGFVGINLGNDLKVGTKDDRNEFNSQYYANNTLNVYSYTNETNKNILEYANYQTLFGKDYYVILRPSLLFKSATIKVTTNPKKMSYIQNLEKLDLTGGILTVTYDNKTLEKISLTDENIKVTGFNNTKVGLNTITIEYAGKTTTFNVNIVAKKINKIEVTTNPKKMSYIQNLEKLDLTGGILTVTYDDETFEKISLTDENIKVTGFDNTKSGTNNITLEYAGLKVDISVSILKNNEFSDNKNTDDSKLIKWIIPIMVIVIGFLSISVSVIYLRKKAI